MVNIINHLAMLIKVQITAISMPMFQMKFVRSNKTFRCCCIFIQILTAAWVIMKDMLFCQLLFSRLMISWWYCSLYWISLPIYLIWKQLVFFLMRWGGVCTEKCLKAKFRWHHGNVNFLLIISCKNTCL